LLRSAFSARTPAEMQAKANITDKGKLVFS